MRSRVFRLLAFLAAAAAAACGPPAGLFSETNARAHVQMLAGTIGSRPAGSEANTRARTYIIDQLRLFGFQVRVQETDARRPDAGLTARVSNIIATLQGERPEGFGIVSHYDSRPDTQGAGDDAFGVAVALEAARVLAAQESRPWTIFVILTDAEEVGLMGAAGVTTDRDVMDRMRAYMNLEAIGADKPVMLFQAGPGNAWLTGLWARFAPRPRGGSFGTEVYKHLPSDTDFTVFERHEIPGLNFAAAGDSYSYHTDRDAADRVTRRALRDMGENVVSIARALHGVDITQRSSDTATFFDVAGMRAVSYGPVTALFLTIGAMLFGSLAWVKMAAATIRLGGFWRWLLTFSWALLGAVVVVGAMVLATGALRAAREVYHPWYARPDWLVLLLSLIGATAGWTVSRLGQWLPARAHGLRHPAVTWAIALPVWLAFSGAALFLAPGAAYLWIVPLGAAGVLLLVVPSRSGPAIRVASVLILAVAGVLWVRDGIEVVRFAVATLGRMPYITPVFVYAALVALAAVMVAPPFIAATAAARPLLRPSLVTALLLIATVIATALAYTAPAYTPEQPLRRYARALQEAGAQTSTWEVAGLEPGLDLGPDAPGGWAPAAGQPPGSVPWGSYGMPFTFRSTQPPIGPAPATIASFTVASLEAGHELTVTVVPQRPALRVAFVLPEGVTPARSNLPGVGRLGRWTATYFAAPLDGVRFTASFSGIDPARLRDVRVVVTEGGVPEGEGWQRLPPWLPLERMTWSVWSSWSIAPAFPPIEPVPPLPPPDGVRR
jgi:hypothetical protein